jgi:oligoribonuclease NrnB/cAMP/cGMP phosphodiesterase (DHH superfamily)
MESNIDKVCMDNYPYKVDYPELKELYDFESKTIKVEDVDFVITHGNCSDGFMSRVIVEKEMRENPTRFKNKLENVTFIDAHHGANFTGLPDQMKGKTVLICDFSFYPSIFKLMIEATGGKILILDHHVTAQSNLKDIDPKFVVFDMNHSGAFITQMYVNGFQSVPRAILYVEDNDIWIKKLPMTLEFTAYMFLQDFEYESYSKLFDDDYVKKTVIPIGVGAVIQNTAHIESIVKKTTVSFIEIKGRYYMVSNVNCANILKSELGNHCMTKFLNSNFSVCYTQNSRYGTTTISIRSLDDRTDCSFIAQHFGGGGHRNASGMSVSGLVTMIPGNCIDEYRAYDMLNSVYVNHTGNGTETGNALILNTPVMKSEFAKYLMQERYYGDRDSVKNKPRYDKGSAGYQEGLFVMRNNMKNQDLDKIYDAAICWNYDGGSNRYNISICARNDIIDKVIKSLDLISNLINSVGGLGTISVTKVKGMIYVVIDSMYCSIHKNEICHDKVSDFWNRVSDNM